MIKKELQALRTLKATPNMMEMAKNDKKEKRKYKRWGWEYTTEAYEYSIFMRCQVLKGYLKVAFFIPSHMRCGSNMPVYELFIHKDAGQYLTYDCTELKWREAMLDNLDWPIKWYAGKAWINPEGNQTIKKYLKVEKSGFDGIIEWQRKVKEEAKERKYKRQTDAWDQELKLTPKVPKDWKSWCGKVAVPEHFIFYDYVRNGARHGYCTYCEKEVQIEKPAHNKKTICSCCGKTVVFKSRKKQKYLHTERHYAYLIQRTKTGFVVREFWSQNTYRQDENWKKNNYTHEIRRAFFDKNARMTKSYSWELFRNRTWRFCGTANCALTWCGRDRGVVYGRTLPSLAKIELKTTGLPEYLKMHPRVDAEWYLAVWNRYPQLEQLVKAGLSKLVEDCMQNISILEEVYNTKVSGGMAKKMHLDDHRLKRLRDNDGGAVFLRWLRHEKKTGKTLSDEMIRYFSDQCSGPGSISFARDLMSDVQIYNYIRKQCDLTGKRYHDLLTTWKDYLSMAKRNGLNVNDLYVFRPARLKQRHDELIIKEMMDDLKKAAEKTSKEYPTVEGILQEIKDIYGYTGEKYAVLVPENILDIMVEGKSLNHCVGSSSRYMERIERRESYIMFLRKTEALQQSYYTLEVEPDGTVRQKRTTDDEQQPDIEDATKFLRQWQKEIAKRLTEKERSLAKRSKELRMEGFEQMRRDHVTIYTGSLRGQLLVDVLMADLIENKEVKTA